MNVLSPSVLFFVALGGALGSVARHLVVVAADAWLGTSFAWGTLLVNVVGAGLAGVITGMMAEGAQLSPALRGYVMVGLIGGFTTFSAVNFDLWSFWHDSPFLSFFYGTLMLGLTLFSFAVCLALGRNLMG